MKNEFYDFYLWLKGYYIDEWVKIKELQPACFRLYREWDEYKLLYGLRSFNHFAAPLFSEYFDVDLPLDLDKWGLNTCYFETDEISFQYVTDLQARLECMLRKERGFICEGSNF